MITKVKLPKADANMNEGTIGKWLVSVDDEVTKGDPIVEVITDKTVFEFESPKSGILRKITAPVNSIVPPGYVLALIGKADDELPEVGEYNRKLLDKYLQEQEVALEKKPKAAKKTVSGKSGAGKVRATPSAKRLAKENQLDLSQIQSMFNVDVINEKVVEEYLKTKK